MSVNKLNKVTGLPPEKQIIEDHHGPSKTLKETIAIVKKIKSDLGDVEHFVEKLQALEGSGAQKPRALAEQLIRAKQEMVKLELALREQRGRDGDEEEAEADEWIFDD